MKCICNDFRRAVTGRWFPVALFASAASLYLSIGASSWDLLDWLSESAMYGEGFWLDAASLLSQGLQGDFGVMILPALSALPFAVQALQEIRSGVFRPAVFRVGRGSWVAGKLLSTLISGMLLQAAAALVLLLGLHLITRLCTGAWFPRGILPPSCPCCCAGCSAAASGRVLAASFPC